MSFTPKDEFSENLLASIPKKVYAMLEAAGENPTPSEMEWSNIRLHMNPNASSLGSITYFDQKFFAITIMWTGSADNPQKVSGSKAWMQNIAANLLDFVELEKKIYAQVESYCDFFKQERDIQTLQATAFESKGRTDS